MGIDAIALLRLSSAAIPTDRILRTLDDGVLVKTGAPFDEEPEELALLLSEIVGDALDDHDDPRGVLMIPDVAQPKGKKYDEVVEEIGEGGTWISLDADPQQILGGLFSSVMDAMQSPDVQRALVDAREAAAGARSGATDHVTSAQERMIALARSLSGAIAPGQEEAAEREMRKMIARSGGVIGADQASMQQELESMLGDPDLRKMVEDVGAQLAADPEKLAVLQQMLVGDDDEDEDEQDEEEDDPDLSN